MAPEGLNVAVVYGGRSVEHDVSIITALQVMDALDARHTPVPLYLSRSGAWYTGDSLRDLESYRGGAEPDATRAQLDLATGVLRASVPERRGGFFSRGGGGGPTETEVRVDVAIPAAHGTYGEDGSLQGALEMTGVAYAGSDVRASAAAMDKSTTKAVLREARIPVLSYRVIGRHDWERDREAAVSAALRAGEPPLYVKPVALGSSIGVTRCTDRAQVEEALELVFELDRAAIVEPAVEGGYEVNCAVLGRPSTEPRASVCEQPTGEGFLSYEDKYLSGEKGMASADRLIPAPIGDDLTTQIQDLAGDAFVALGCSGVARVDFLVDADGKPWVNEVNTIPGSFSFYLWEPAGVPFTRLMDELIELALAEHAEKQRTTRTFASTLLEERAGAKSGGSKG